MADASTSITVGVFDSGLGGLSILGAIRHLIPNVNLVYCCDNKNFPYGTKSEVDVRRAAKNVTSLFFNNASLDVLVIACNTASVVALEAIRESLPIPVIGVVPAVKPAAQMSKTKFIGILATPVTIARPYLDELIANFADGCRVVKVGSSKLVALAEYKILTEPTLGGDKIEEIKKELQPIIDASANGLDQVVLGCTHFPLLSKELRRVLPKTVNFVDSGQAVASRVLTVLEERHGFCSTNRGVNFGQISGYCSGDSMTVNTTEELFMGGLKIELRKLI
jgi:glutamate racemase